MSEDLESKIKAAADKVLVVDSNGNHTVSEENAQELVRLLKARLTQLDHEVKQGGDVNESQ
jgi:hypothetical protein